MFKSIFNKQSNKSSVLLNLCEGKHRWPKNSPYTSPAMQKALQVMTSPWMTVCVGWLQILSPGFRKHEAYIITLNVEQSRWYNILMIISTTSIDGLQKKLYAMICNHTCLLCVLLRFLSNYNVVCLVLTKEPRHCIYATLSLVGLGIYIYQENNPFGDSGVSAHVQMILSHTARDIVTICLFIWP